MNTFRITAIFLMAGAVAAQTRATDAYNGHEVVANQAILQIDLARYGGQIPAVLGAVKSAGNADDVRPLSQTLGMYLLHSPAANVAALMNVLKNVPGVTFVEPNYVVKAVGQPNDPNFSQQWDMFNAAVPGADIGATQAWNVSTGSAANVIGVVDTGIDYNHPDLAANVWSAPSQFTVSLSWGTLTCPAGSHGYNAQTHGCSPLDDNQHGTHVSGTIGAIGNNGIGVAGVNWTTQIMALKFLDSTGNGTVSDAIDAIEFGLQAKQYFGPAANVRVLSNSWGGSGFAQALLNEINRANSADVLFVVAAGNSGSSDDTSPTYPASFTAPNMITVAATTSTDGLASFSNYGHSTVQLGAPGVNILSTLPNNAYGFMSGTSMATPHVSGAAMLVLSQCALNTAGLKNALLANVDVIGGLQGVTATGGRLNVNKAIRSCASVAPPVSGSAVFVTADGTTAGSWAGVYGSEGYNVINNATSYPSYVTVTPSGNGGYTWVSSTTDSRATQKAAPATDRLAACWFSGGAFNVDFTFSDSATHQVALYLLDWDDSGGGRNQRVDILDANGNTLDSRTVVGFTGGQYLVWNLSGHVIARVANNTPGNNAVLSGIFFGGGSAPAPLGSTAAFLKTDTTTMGSWAGVYGADGYNVINNATSYPAYVTVNPAGTFSYTWIGSTTDTRAMQKAGAQDRIAACWFSVGSFDIDLTFNDSSAHQVALYLLDWDNSGGGRSQRVDVLDASGNLLDTRGVSGFHTGQYLVWNLSGHVVLRVTNTSPGNNAVVSGLLFK